ncbi:hypothetical protein AGDE_00800 [Angomonas deanei]|uniref:CWF21 domain-containing protein n=1 Tax=Angomonas deanei TaxID=59799 RepID=S9VQH1_9TRYP|nr:hypothetical protein AGDE_10277 [Angomonas deanei]EPY40319.1 hypothetical protein AGDE_03609 [Angomonas deanei]EPY43123.1 hypothetical protein AGDE_00800 [Angomonas deanei]CAD2221170.1 hypothetical protein, conserved [Angomonas deanei]|eukprot:EPY28798.1 hypothetical protein AGDE_10277 [Angomonas deanei]
MHNGIEAAQVKGTGLSGYVQRSKATVQTSNLSKFRSIDDDEGSPAETINPLLQKRTEEENLAMARRLEVHKAIRSVRLKVLLYGRERLEKNIDPDTVERECEEYYTSLMKVTKEELTKEQRSIESKTAERFAEAFGVKTKEYSPFDLAKKEDERRRHEEELIRQREQQLAEKTKRLKEE